ncbi:MAG: phosphotransferase [Streptosporangiales bacterium]|nr:phosphotransferase [Streptosporangiales bacterium]
MTVEADVPEVPGVDSSRLRRWLADAVPEAAGLRHVELIAGGRSNLTYLLETSGPRVVLRRPPLGHVLPTAHDMGREYRVLSALADTAVPAPKPLALCTDEDVIGAPFYVMEYVEGRILRTAEDVAGLSEADAARLSEELVTTLAAIHAVDVEAVGLGDFGRPAGYLERQLRRWNQQWEKSVTRELPAYDRLLERLRAGLPSRSAAGLVHGDYRLDNALVRTDPPAVAAVVDWEMSTLGDPLADVGLTLTYWTDPDDDDPLPVGAKATARPGFYTGRRFAARYAELTGTDVDRIDYYVAFGCFKLAVILEGIHARYRQGKTVGEGFETIGAAVPDLVERAHRILDDARA